MSPRRKPLSHFGTPPPSVSRLTPPYFEFLENRPRREKEAYETLIQEGGQPSHPIELTLSAVKKLQKYKDIISYWKQFRDCERTPYSTQLADWRAFRTFQDRIRAHYQSQNSFPDYPRYVNELRRRHNFEGNADIRLDYTQQSGLDEWMEYQHHHLENCDNLEEPLNRAKGELDAAKKELYEAGDLKFGDEFEEIRSNYSEDSDRTEDSDCTEDSHWNTTLYDACSREPFYWNLLEHKIHKAQIVTKYAEREVEFLKHQSKVVEPNSSKEISESDQTKAASAMKRVEDAKKKVNKLKLRLKLVEAARALATIKGELKFHKIVVDWIEQQKPLIAAR